jgi:uncharacterized protein (DUF58 family)
MLTSRGWWLLMLVLFTVALGTVISFDRPGDAVGSRGAVLPIIGLTIIAWFLIEGVRFHIGVRGNLPRLRIEREVREVRGPLVTLWAGRTYEVIVRVTTDTRVPTPWVMIDDRFPFGVQLAEGGVHEAGSASRDRPVEVRYRIKCRAAGPVRFEGVRLRFADPQGFFFHDTFLRSPLVYPVLPPLVDAEANRRTGKTYNVLMPPGVHRMRRPGSGSELLELRDYRPGDPPKMIAWKPSARKDKLITKEFETEVPVRCTLLLDASQSVRIGPTGRNSLARLVEIASASAQASLANRDPVGLIVFDEIASSYLTPARGRRHLIDLLRRLAEVGRLPPSPGQTDADTLVQIASPFAHEVYPDLLRADLNGWRWWLPILFPKPEYLRRLTLSDAIFPWLRRFSLGAWKQEGLRKRMAALLAVQQGTAPGGLAILSEDDEFFGKALQRFLDEHNVPHPVPMYDWRGKYLFSSPEKIDVLETILLRAVRRAHDNELFVLLVDLFELGDRLEPLRRAVRVALGRHHQVMLVCPWLPDMPPFDERLALPTHPGDTMAITRRATILRYHRAYETVRHDFGRLGVTVVTALQRDSIQLILDRMDQLRVGGIRRR